MPDPFGLKGGSTPPIGMAEYVLLFHAVPKPHPAFLQYRGKWSPEHGLTNVFATTKSFEDEADCHSARAVYRQVQRQLESVYGPFDSIETVDQDAVWPDESDFYNALRNDERTHACRWSVDSGARLDAGITTITLSVVANDGYDSSEVMLNYEFPGPSHAGLSDEYGLDSL